MNPRIWRAMFVVPFFLSLLVITGTAQAQLVPNTRIIKYCFRLGTDFDDEIGLEDWSTTSEFFQRARGAKVTVHDDCASLHEHTLSATTGCADIPVHATGQYTVTIHAQAVVRGVTLLSYTFDAPTTSAYYIPSFTVTDNINTVLNPRPVVLVPLPHSANDNIENRSLAWHSLAVGMWAMSRSTYNLGDFGNKTGCTGLTFPGSSTRPCCGYKAWMDAQDPDPRGWNHDNISPTALVFFVPNGIDQDNFASTWKNCPLPQFDTGAPDGVIPAVAVPQRAKFQIAHELGHVIVMQRMGYREDENYDSWLGGCMGSFTGTLGNYLPADSGGVSEKSELTREYSSGAAREGWAHFFSAWLFNNAAQADCWFDSSYSVQDFDLDGFIDNDTPLYDSVFTCEGAGIGAPMPGALQPWVTAHDWLKDAYDAGKCDWGTVGYFGRSTQYDWMRYFWDMASDESVPINDLADVFVDMCPTEWDAAPQTTVSNSNWPERRLLRSVTYHGFATAHSHQKFNGVDHY